MSKLRKWKARNNKYPEWSDIEDLGGQFYQFALNENEVISKLEQIGFTFVEKKLFSGIIGLTSELDDCQMFTLLKSLSNSNKIGGKMINRLLNEVLSPLSSHCVLLVMRKSA